MFVGSIFFCLCPTCISNPHSPSSSVFNKQRSNPERAGELTHREAGYVTEIVTTAALDRGFNVLVDGSLWDHEWYEQYFKALRRKYKVLRIAIIHITAPRDAILERAKVSNDLVYLLSQSYFARIYLITSISLFIKESSQRYRSSGTNRNTRAFIRTGTDIC